MNEANSAPLSRWYPIGEGVKLLATRLGDIDAAIEFLIERGDLGDFRAKASRANGRYDTRTIAEEDWDIPGEVWQRISGQNHSRWLRGDLRAGPDPKDRWMSLEEQDRSLVLIGVKISREDLHAICNGLPDPNITPMENSSPLNSRSGRGRNLSHDHPYAAASVALELMNLPIDERSRLTDASVGSSLEQHYLRSHPEGRIPHKDSLDDYGHSILTALRDFWEKARS